MYTVTTYLSQSSSSSWLGHACPILHCVRLFRFAVVVVVVIQMVRVVAPSTPVVGCPGSGGGGCVVNAGRGGGPSCWRCRRGHVVVAFAMCVSSSSSSLNWHGRPAVIVFVVVVWTFCRRRVCVIDAGRRHRVVVAFAMCNSSSLSLSSWVDALPSSSSSPLWWVHH